MAITVPSVGTPIIAGWGDSVANRLNDSDAAWGAYTPVLTATTTNPTLGNSTLTGAFLQIGKRVHWRLALFIGSTFSVGSGDYLFTIPVAATANASIPVGHGFTNNGGASRALMCVDITSTTFKCVRTAVEGSFIANTGAGAAWATGHSVCVGGTYEAA